MTEQQDCPHCGALLDLEDMRARSISHCASCGETLDAPGSPVAAALTPGYDLPFAFERPPEFSGIDVVQATADHLVFTLPPGGKRGTSLGCFAIIWLTITGIVSGGFLFGGGQGEEPLFFLIPFFGIFWAVGLGLLYLSLKMKFTRGYLFLQPDRAVLQTIFLGRKRNEETALSPRSRSSLASSYRENGNPVYRVDLNGSDRILSFGTAWDDPPKEWFVRTINSFLDYHDPSAPVDQTPVPANVGRDPFGIDLHVDTRSGKQECLDCGEVLWNLESAQGDPQKPVVYCPACGCQLILRNGRIKEGISQRRLSPAELSPSTPLAAEKTSSGDWTISYRAGAEQTSSSFFGCFVAFGLIWMIFPLSIATFVVPPVPFMRVIALIFAIAFATPGLLIFALGAFAKWGRIRVTIGSERCAVRWSLGPFGYTQSGPTESVSEIKLIRGTYASQMKSRQPRQDQSSFSDSRMYCILNIAGRALPVTFGQNPPLSRDSAALIRFALDDLGIRLPNG